MHATTWMDFESMCRMVLLYKVLRMGKFIPTENKTVTRGWGKKGWRVIF
jgi:hypothetical protein